MRKETYKPWVHKLPRWVVILLIIFVFFPVVVLLNIGSAVIETWKDMVHEAKTYWRDSKK